jgi:hypothetical protein
MIRFHVHSAQFPGSRKWNPIWSARDPVSAIGSARIEISIGELKCSWVCLHARQKAALGHFRHRAKGGEIADEIRHSQLDSDEDADEAGQMIQQLIAAWTKEVFRARVTIGRATISRIVRTHCTIRTNETSPGNCHRKSWLAETSADRKDRREFAREENNERLTGSLFAGTFAVASSGECRFVRLVNVGKKRCGTDGIWISVWDVFGALSNGQITDSSDVAFRPRGRGRRRRRAGALSISICRFKAE